MLDRKAVVELAQMLGELGRIEDAKRVLREHVNSSLGARSLVKPARLSATKIVVVTRTVPARSSS